MIRSIVQIAVLILILLIIVSAGAWLLQLLINAYFWLIAVVHQALIAT